MDSKKSPKGRKRSAKGGPSISTSLVEEHYWDCSVCTFRNNAEAFKCSMCDVRKGTSTRKPRLNPDLVAQQQAQALTPPPASLLAGSSAAGSSSEAGPSSTGVKSPASVEDEEMGEEEEEDETDLAALASLKANKRLSKEKPVKEKKKELKKEIKKESKKPINKAKLKNVDRNSATYHSVTVNDFTVVITEFKPKIKKEKDKKEPKAHGQANPGSTNSSSSSPTSSAANTPAPTSLTNSIDKQLNGNNSNSFESAVHGSTNINSASGNTNTLSVDKDKNRVPSPNDPVLESSEGIKDRQPVLAAALQSPLKYTGSSTKLNLLGTSRSTPNSLSSSEQDVPPHISTSRPPAISSSTHYPHGGVHPPPRPHPHHHQLSPNPNKMSNHSKLQGNDRHPLPGYPHARPSQTPPSSIPSTNKSTPGVLSPTNNIKGSSSNSTSGPTSRASSASSSVSSVSSSSPASTLASSTHRHSSSSGNSANGSMTSPKNSNLSRNT